MALAVGTLSVAHAQDIEPRAYSNAPIGVNFLIAGYAYTEGAVPFDSSLPVKKREPQNVQRGSRLRAGARPVGPVRQVRRHRALYLAVRIGRPGRRTDRAQRQRLRRSQVSIVGKPVRRARTDAEGVPGLQAGPDHRREPAGVSAFGPVRPEQAVNIGTNRWSFKPEVGISKAMGPWTLELQAAATFFTDNNDFFGGNTRSQAPLYSMQGHVIYGFRSGIWASLDATYFTGGRTTLNGARNEDLQQNWRVGGTLAFPVDAPQLHQALRQQRRIGTHRQQLRPARDCLAVSLGRGAVIPASFPYTWICGDQVSGSYARAPELTRSQQQPRAPDETPSCPRWKQFRERVQRLLRKTIAGIVARDHRQACS